MRAMIRKAITLYEKFTGEKGKVVGRVDKPVIPDVLIVIGELDFVGYTTFRDSETQKYIHKFQKKARPLLLASFDGSQLYILGGEYDFTARGIVDKT